MAKAPEEGAPLPVVIVHGLFHHVEYPGYCRAYPVPARDERGAQRVFHEDLRSHLYGVSKGLDGLRLHVPVVDEAVYGGVGLVLHHGVLGEPQVGDPEGVEEALAEDHALGRQHPEERLAYIHAHPHEPLLCVIRRDGLVLVLVVVGYVHLAYPPRGVVPRDLGEHAHLEAPVPGYPGYPRQVSYHGELPCKGVAEAVEEVEVIVGADDLLQGPYERGYEEPRHPSVHAVAYPRVITLAEDDVYGGVYDGVYEPGEHVPAVGDDVAVVDCYDAGLPSGYDVAVGHPCGPTLAVLPHPEVVAVEGGVYLPYPLALVMDYLDVIGYDGHEVLRLLDLLVRGPPEGQDYLFYVLYLL